MVTPPVYTTSEELAANLGIDVLRFASIWYIWEVRAQLPPCKTPLWLSQRGCGQCFGCSWMEWLLGTAPKAWPTGGASHEYMNTLGDTIAGYYLPFGVMLPVQMYAGSRCATQPFTGWARADGGSGSGLPPSCAAEPKCIHLRQALDEKGYYGARMISRPFRAL